MRYMQLWTQSVVTRSAGGVGHEGSEKLKKRSGTWPVTLVLICFHRGKGLAYILVGQNPDSAWLCLGRHRVVR